MFFGNREDHRQGTRLPGALNTCPAPSCRVAGLPDPDQRSGWESRPALEYSNMRFVARREKCPFYSIVAICTRVCLTARY